MERSLEMAQTKLILFSVVLALAGCVQTPVATNAGPRFGYTWQKVDMDGSRTATSAVTGTDIASALGTLENGVYTAPNGRKFRSATVTSAAAVILEAQPGMAHLKDVLGHSTRTMDLSGYESELGNWAADALKAGVETLCGKPVDLAIMNKGGIRVDMPDGDVIMEDIVSMFPFSNKLCWVQLRGSDVRALLEQMASTRMQCLSGARVVIKDKELVEAEIGGQPLDDRKLYGVGTIDFLLDGGDDLFIGRNALQTVCSTEKICEWMVPYIRSLTAGGRSIEAEIDGRVEVLK